MLLLRGNPEHAGITNLLGPQSLEERVGGVGRGNNLAASESHPLTLEAAEYLGKTQGFRSHLLLPIPNYSSAIYALPAGCPAWRRVLWMRSRVSAGRAPAARRQDQDSRAAVAVVA
jgi:hypothetical protein